MCPPPSGGSFVIFGHLFSKIIQAQHSIAPLISEFIYVSPHCGGSFDYLTFVIDFLLSQILEENTTCFQHTGIWPAMY